MAIVAHQNDYVFREVNGQGGTSRKNNGLLKLPSFRRSSKLKKSSKKSNNNSNHGEQLHQQMGSASVSETETDNGTTTSTSASSASTTDEPSSEQAPSNNDAHVNATSHNPHKTTTATTHKVKKQNIASRSPEENAEFFQEVFEIGRRNKVLNPSKMRSTYGKLMYMLQDSQSPNVAKGLGFSLYKEMVMVGPHLAEMQIDELLSDARLLDATMHVNDLDEGTGLKIGRDEVQKMIRRKRDMQQELVQEYGRKAMSSVAAIEDSTTAAHDLLPTDTSRYEAEVQRCIDSLADAVSVIESNVAPVRRMLSFLENNFDPKKAEPDFSLKLSGSSFSSMRTVSAFSSYNGMNRFGFGGGGADSDGPTLSHSHPTQYTFVWQSLKLWCKVQENMHKLWVCADDDLLSTTHGYSLWNTGQGLNRVQTCPRVAKVMHTLLGETRNEAGQAWVGLSVVHLGDRDVPNALIFIDKVGYVRR